MTDICTNQPSGKLSFQCFGSIQLPSSMVAVCMRQKRWKDRSHLAGVCARRLTCQRYVPSHSCSTYRCFSPELLPSVLLRCSGSGPIVLDDVVCTGGEQSLLECNSTELLGHNCGHHEDAGVICPASESKAHCSVVWCCVVWCAVVLRCGVVLCGVVWCWCSVLCGVVWCCAWCGVVWCDA